MLSDLRAEVKPRGVLDLEMVANRSTIEGSRDLQSALKSKILQLGRHTVIHTPAKSPEKYSNQDLAKIVRQAVKDEMISNKSEPVVIMQPPAPVAAQPSDDMMKNVVQDGFDKLLNSLRDKIDAIQPRTESPQTKQESSIDPAKFAEISQNAVDRISEGIETSDTQFGKKHKIKKNIHDIANEL